MNYERVTSLQPLAQRSEQGHKGTFGRVLVVGGNAQMIGAPAFCGLAAYHAGAGYVQLATPKVILLAALGLCPQAIGLALPNAKEWHDAIDKADAIAIGPGLGKLADAKRWVGDVLSAATPVVLDADALNLLAAGRSWPKRVAAACVLTPHPGEMKRLGKLFGKTDQNNDDEADRIDTATRAALAFGQVVVLKGHRTIVTDGQKLYINTTGSSALAKAGSGDILSGIAGALLGQRGAAPFEAACTAVWVHGKAGEFAGQRVGERSSTSFDVVTAVGAAFDAYAEQFGTRPPTA
ncbi:MAG: NAD(P)H-hydrate dehydratase [Tepidisphaeraceae bacterium]